MLDGMRTLPANFSPSFGWLSHEYLSAHIEHVARIVKLDPVVLNWMFFKVLMRQLGQHTWQIDIHINNVKLVKKMKISCCSRDARKHVCTHDLYGVTSLFHFCDTSGDFTSFSAKKLNLITSRAKANEIGNLAK